MGRLCAVPNCRRAAGERVSWHRIPTNENRKKLWISTLNELHKSAGKELIITNSTAICSKHFPADAYNKSGRLMFNAVPSLFSDDSRQRRNSEEPLVEECSSGDEQGSVSNVNPQDGPITPPNIFQNCSNENELVPIVPIVHDPATPKTPVGGNSGKQITLCNRKKNRKFYFGDLSPSDFQATPRSARKNCQQVQHEVVKLRGRLRISQQKLRRAKKKIKDLESMLKHLKDKRLLSEDAAYLIENTFDGPAKGLLARALKKKRKAKYSEELRQFALTLNFHSAKAYDYVRKEFCNALPHPRTISKWYANFDCKPGFTEEAHKAVKVKVEDAERKGKKIVCSLIVDEMAIRKEINFKGQQVNGVVDFGSGVNHEGLLPAKEATVFMLVAINDSWKIPIGYFFINSMNAEERANLVQHCLTFIHSTGVIVKSLTFDGTATNFAMASALGANLNPESMNFKPNFEHIVTKKPVHIFLDPCHMLKLVRNTLGSDRSGLKDGEGREINWKFLEELVSFQEKEGLNAANKLKRRHLNFQKEKMRVSLATQTLSSSTATALNYLEFDLKVPSFIGSSATADFIKIFNDLFDILNSRNFLHKGLKAPLSRENIAEAKEFLLKARKYILTLTDNGLPIMDSPRKTGFRGFIICIDSALGLFEDVVESGLLQFIPLYKISQDHVEMFFSWIRSKGGHNNNPSTVQFTAAYKRILVKVELSHKKGANCWPLEMISILNVPSSSVKKSIVEEEEQIHVDDTFAIFDLRANDVDYTNNVIQPVQLSNFASDIIEYIAGFVSRSVAKMFPCATCCYSLFSDIAPMKLIQRKNLGGLLFPTADVLYLCRLSEQELKVCNIQNSALLTKFSCHVIRTKRMINKPIFCELDLHILEQDAINNHKSMLVDCIVKKYLNVRLHYDASKITELCIQQRVRSVNTKIVHFKNQ